MSFLLSRVEGLVKGLVSTGELDQSINKLRGDLAKNMKGDLANLQGGINGSEGKWFKIFPNVLNQLFSDSWVSLRLSSSI